MQLLKRRRSSTATRRAPRKPRNRNLPTATEPSEEPLRAELFNVDQLGQHAKVLAGWHHVDERRGRTKLLSRLDDNERVLLASYEVVAASAQQGRQVTPAAEWLLDNFYLIEEQLRTARRHLPQSYSRELPRLTTGASAGLPRVYDLALELIAHVDGRLDEHALRSFVGAYQTATTLKLGELWAIPIMLRLALLENLRRVASRVADERLDRDRANHWADQLLAVGEKDQKALILAVAELVTEDPPLTTAFVAEFTRRVQGQSASMVFPLTWLEQRLAETGQTTEQLIQQESQKQAADQVSIGNSINSLRFLSAMRWREFIEAMSAVERVLRTDPLGTYPAMDFQTRDRYRHVVERIARYGPTSEEDVSRLAIQLAQEAISRNGTDERRRHVGYYLVDKGRPLLERTARMRSGPAVMVHRFARRLPLALYLGTIVLVTLLACAGLFLLAKSAHAPTWAFIVLLVPALVGMSRVGMMVANWLATLLLSPCRLPRMNLEDGIPETCRTLVIVPALLSGHDTIQRLVDSLEVYYLANRDRHLHLGLLTDFPDADQEQMPDDEASLRQVTQGIQLLNEKYGVDREDIFYLFHRPRRWNAQEGVWMGWERKRGKLTELNAFLRGRGHDFFSVVLGDTAILSHVRFVITLDADTQLPRDAARELIATMAHPLNRPAFDPKTGCVVEGYAILQPRVEITLVSTARTRFARLFAGEAGLDPYTRMVSDVYQDAFFEGSFIGKGIYDVDAFERACAGKFPENRILSHDLLEGSYARAGLVSDVTFLEDFPAAYTVEVSRRHRWMRGDWQIAAWIFNQVPGPDGSQRRNPISLLSRWKIFDNLRRSLVPPSLLILLLAGWALAMPLRWTLAVLSVFALTPLMGGFTHLVRKSTDLPWSIHLRHCLESFGRETAQALLEVCFLPFDAFISVDAIVRTAHRVHVTRKRLLDWQTASEAARKARTTLRGYYHSKWPAPLAGAVAVLLAWHANAATVVAIGMIGMAWLLAPGVAWFLSRPLKGRAHEFAADELSFLHEMARRTWRYFETFVAAADNYLPPDNFQEHPTHRIAHRTSPTNIGLSLLANLSAYDFGYLSATQLLDRTDNTLNSLEKLERFRDQFYNWYDTRTLQPLNPHYVSSVDSGNLAVSLMTLRGGLLALREERWLPARTIAGFQDTLHVLLAEARGPKRAFGASSAIIALDSIAMLERMQNELERPPQTLGATHVLLERLMLAVTQFAATQDASANTEVKWWSRALERQVREALDQLMYLAPWLALPPPTEMMWRRGSPEQIRRLTELRDIVRELHGDLFSLSDLARLESRMVPALDAIQTDLASQDAPTSEKDWFVRLTTAIKDTAARAARRLERIELLAARCEELSDLNYDFLYDATRHLFAVGYNVTDLRRDNSFYDLLASEARLAVFIGIAQGKLPQEAWFALGRSLTTSGRETVLLSWSGSMFEYLMPLLVMPTYPHTLLDETYRGVVCRQIEYGRQRRVPWGVSESGYAATDIELNYQYRAFGVPGLGLKQGLAEDLVIAPYAAALALMVDPRSACENLRRLGDDGYLTDYGFYEAIDFTPSRARRDGQPYVVRSWMAHHQGMSLLALDYLLKNQPMQRRFLSDPLFRATELLLQERVPYAAPIFPHAFEASVMRRTPIETEGSPFRVFTTPNTPTPEVHLLSNGRYHVMVTAAGGGYSRWRDFALTRWQEDSTRDPWGTFCYVREPATGEFWSTTHQPTLKRAKPYEAIFSEARAEFRRRDNDIDIHTDITVSPEDDIELRRMTITNRSRYRRTIELTSYAEAALAPPAADAAHLVFSKLFVQTEIIPTRQAILCTRRPRSERDPSIWFAHLMVVQGEAQGEASYETDRARFIGRGRTLASPAAMHTETLSNTQGAVLDPIASIRRQVVLEPDASVQIHLVSGASETREGVMSLIEKYHDTRLADRVFELAWTHSQVVLRQLDATAAPGPTSTTEADAQLYGRIASAVIYANPTLRAKNTIIARNRRGQSGLWGYGISGDLPIVLLRIAKPTEIDLVRRMVQAHAYWRLKGLPVDLVIWNEDQSGYRQDLQDRIMGLIASGSEAQRLDRPGGIFVRRSDQISDEDRLLFQAIARVIVTDSGGTLAEQINRRPRSEARAARFAPIRTHQRALPGATSPLKRDLAFFNGIGGFTRDGREYIVTTFENRMTAAPWSNVIANPEFGTVVTESGGGYTWVENAHEYRLTPWYNDPVVDTCGEAFYVRDEETGRFWSPTPLPARGSMPYSTRHGFGYTVFEYSEDGIVTELTTFVAMDGPVKFWRIKLRNVSGRTRRISLTGYVEWVLGEHRDRNMMHVMTEVEPKSGAILAKNSFIPDLAGRVAFFDVSESQRTMTADRREFIGRNGSLANPIALEYMALSGKIGAGLDPCAALQTTLELANGQEREVTFVLGVGRGQEDAVNLIQRFHGNGPSLRALQAVWEFWKQTLGAIHIETPDPATNYLVNGWLLYQVLSCRMWARSGFYQSGGAFGFRDQLQDSLALLHSEPRLIREHILRCAAHQFRQGDVQHWWHPPTDRGVRTRFSDDYLWLPYVVAQYVESTGDTGLLEEQVKFIEGRPLNPDEDSYYDQPSRSEDVGTIYDHCVRAINYGLKFGDHGLPLMGCGDWNDGMNLVGIHGKGESVWLAFFLYDVLTQFSELADDRGDDDMAGIWREQAQKLRANTEQHAWDGQWYRRAYFDNGDPIGASSNQECQIDALPQSWAVISRAGDPDRCRTALAEVDRRLVHRDSRLIQLFDPPFDKTPQNPGYIKGYLPGVRENGAQYTHAAIWTIMGFAMSGDSQRAWELLSLINPIRHAESGRDARIYAVEPYIVAADVYTNPQHVGRGGWTWYTGSAGWFYRVIVETLLGIQLHVDHLEVRPMLPAAWNTVTIHYRYRSTFYHITVIRKPDSKVPLRVTADNVFQPDEHIPLVDDQKEHQVTIELGPPSNQ